MGQKTKNGTQKNHLKNRIDSQHMMDLPSMTTQTITINDVCYSSVLNTFGRHAYCDVSCKIKNQKIYFQTGNQHESNCLLIILLYVLPLLTMLCWKYPFSCCLFLLKKSHRSKSHRGTTSINGLLYLEWFKLFNAENGFQKNIKKNRFKRHRGTTFMCFWWYLK